MASPSLSSAPIQPEPLVPCEEPSPDPNIETSGQGNREIIESVLELRPLTAALSAFQRHFDDLQAHLDFIQTSIDAQLTSQSQTLTTPSTETPTPRNPPVEAPILPSDETLYLVESEVVHLCKTMNGNGLRQYIISHLSDTSKLLEEVPSALKLCPNRAKLVFDCIDQFYLLGPDAYDKNPPLDQSRQASILIMEFFLMAGCNVRKTETEALVREEAKQAAMAWRKRLIDESGLTKTSEIDAKGLLLLIGCFGVPGGFQDDDILKLVRLSNWKEISELLCRSNILINKMKAIIDAKQKKKMDVDALDIALTFHLEVKYSPQSILSAFLRNSKKAFKSAMNSVENSDLSPAFVSFKKQLADLKSLVSCFERHNIDPSELQSGWHPNKRMARIERVIAELDKRKEKAEAKRKAESLRKQKTKEWKQKRREERQKEPWAEKAKRARVSGHGQEPQKASILVGAQIASINGQSGPDSLPGAGPSYGGLVPEPQLAGALAGGPNANLIVHRNGPSRPCHQSDALFEERIAGQSYTNPGRFVGGSCYVRPVGREAIGLSGLGLLPDSYMRYSNPSSVGTADLYGFTDAVLERDTSRESVASRSSAPVTHHPSYMY